MRAGDFGVEWPERVNETPLGNVVRSAMIETLSCLVIAFFSLMDNGACQEPPTEREVYQTFNRCMPPPAEPECPPGQYCFDVDPDTGTAEYPDCTDVPSGCECEECDCTGGLFSDACTRCNSTCDEEGGLFLCWAHLNQPCQCIIEGDDCSGQPDS